MVTAVSRKCNGPPALGLAARCEVRRSPSAHITTTRLTRVLLTGGAGGIPEPFSTTEARRVDPVRSTPSSRPQSVRRRGNPAHLSARRARNVATQARPVLGTTADAVSAAVPARRRQLPVASASLYEPAAGRTWWWLSMRCPHCGSVHLGRVRAEADAPGPRRAGCGRKVFVVVRRTYRGHSSRRVAA
jgi:hypothetical protein